MEKAAAEDKDADAAAKEAKQEEIKTKKDELKKKKEEAEKFQKLADATASSADWVLEVKAILEAGQKDKDPKSIKSFIPSMLDEASVARRVVSYSKAVKYEQPKENAPADRKSGLIKIVVTRKETVSFRKHDPKNTDITETADASHSRRAILTLVCANQVNVYDRADIKNEAPKASEQPNNLDYADKKGESTYKYTDCKFLKTIKSSP